MGKGKGGGRWSDRPPSVRVGRQPVALATVHSQLRGAIAYAGARVLSRPYLNLIIAHDPPLGKWALPALSSPLPIGGARRPSS